MCAKPTVHAKCAVHLIKMLLSNGFGIYNVVRKHVAKD